MLAKVASEPGFFAPKLIKAKLAERAVLTASRLGKIVNLPGLHEQIGQPKIEINDRLGFVDYIALFQGVNYVLRT